MRLTTKLLKKTQWLLGLSSLLLAVGQASAATVELIGTDFTATYDDSELSFYGTPVVDGNVIRFTPETFSSIGVGSTSATINFIITPNNGGTVNSISLTESGAHTGDTFNSEAFGQLRVFNSGQSDDESTSFFGTDLNSGSDNWQESALVDGITGPWTPTAGASVELTLQNNLFSYFSNSSINKTLVELTIDVTPVPVPAAAYLFLSAFASLGLMRIRKL